MEQQKPIYFQCSNLSCYGIRAALEKWPAKRQCATGGKDHTHSTALGWSPTLPAADCGSLWGLHEHSMAQEMLRSWTTTSVLGPLQMETMSDLQQVLGFSSYLFPLRGAALPILTKPGQGRERRGSSKPVPGPGLTQLPHPRGWLVSPSPCKIPHRLCGRLESLVLHHPLQSA